MFTLTQFSLYIDGKFCFASHMCKCVTELIHDFRWCSHYSESGGDDDANVCGDIMKRDGIRVSGNHHPFVVQ